MNINGLKNNAGVYKSQDLKQKDAQKIAQEEDLQRSAQKQSDKLEISTQARILKPILQRVEEGYYDKPEVIRQVARKINEEISSEDK